MTSWCKAVHVILKGSSGLAVTRLTGPDKVVYDVRSPESLRNFILMFDIGPYCDTAFSLEVERFWAVKVIGEHIQYMNANDTLEFRWPTQAYDHRAKTNANNERITTRMSTACEILMYDPFARYERWWSFQTCRWGNMHGSRQGKSLVKSPCYAVLSYMTA